MLMYACDLRLPARLSLEECEIIADVVLSAVADTMQSIVAWLTGCYGVADPLRALARVISVMEEFPASGQIQSAPQRDR